MPNIKYDLLNVLTMFFSLTGMLLTFAFADSNNIFVYIMAFFSLVASFIGLTLIGFIAITEMNR